VNEARYTGTGAQGRKTIGEDYEKQLQEAKVNCQMATQKFISMAQILNQLKMGVEHLASKLFHSLSVSFMIFSI